MKTNQPQLSPVYTVPGQYAYNALRLNVLGMVFYKQLPEFMARYGPAM